MNGEELNLDLLLDDGNIEDTDFTLNEIKNNPPNPSENEGNENKDKKTLVDESSKNDDNNLGDFSKNLDDDFSDSQDGKESVAKEGDSKTPADKESNSSPADNKLSELYSSLAAQLKDAGVLSQLDENTKISSSKELNELIKKELDSKLDDNVKLYQKAIEKGMPIDKFAEYDKQLNELNNITEDIISNENNTNLRLNIIGRDFLNRGYTKEEALKFAQRSIDLGEDIEDAKASLERIKAFTKESFDKELEKADQEKSSVNEKIKTFIDTSDEIIKGIKLTPSVKEKLFNQITSSIDKTETGEPVSAYIKAMKENPVKVRVMNEYMFMITKGFTDFSKINNTIETNKTKELDEILKNTGSSLFQGMGNNDDKESKFGFGDMDIDI